MQESSSTVVREQMTSRALERIYAKIAFPEAEGGCWIWQATTNSRGGYGRVRFEGRLWLVHRLLYKLLIGEIPAGLTLDHLCRRTACANPTHMEAVTIGDNIRRGTRLCRRCGAELLLERNRNG